MSPWMRFVTDSPSCRSTALPDAVGTSVRESRVGRGNEKGHVETHVGYARRNLLVPVPRLSSFSEMNEYLAACCYADLFRRVRGKPETKAERLVIDQAAMLALPSEFFEARRVEQRGANSLSLVRFDRNDYSVPTAFAHHDVTALGGIEQVRLLVGTDVVATHPRCWSKEQVSFDPRHYLALLERKPGALDVARPLKGWDLPECFSVLRRRLEADLASAGTREYIKVLRLMESATLKELTGAVEQALSIGATGRAVRAVRERNITVKTLETKSVVLLHHHLKALRLPTIGAECEKVAKQAAADNVDHLSYLLQLLELELLDREKRSAERRLKAARFPTIKTLESFDFAARPSVNKVLIAELARCEYIDKRENVIMVGNSGHG